MTEPARVADRRRPRARAPAGATAVVDELLHRRRTVVPTPTAWIATVVDDAGAAARADELDAAVARARPPARAACPSR